MEPSSLNSKMFSHLSDLFCFWYNCLQWMIIKDSVNKVIFLLKTPSFGACYIIIFNIVVAQLQSSYIWKEREVVSSVSTEMDHNYSNIVPYIYSSKYWNPFQNLWLEGQLKIQALAPSHAWVRYSIYQSNDDIVSPFYSRNLQDICSLRRWWYCSVILIILNILK